MGELTILTGFEPSGGVGPFCRFEPGGFGRGTQRCGAHHSYVTVPIACATR